MPGRKVLMKKIEEITGYKVRKIRINKIDLTRKQANVMIYYKL